ncbi:MAG TPA: dihydroorotase [Gammaproteobacteria bacterium]|jgi:dihydroorotase|nr:dihydroorotase [Gammaproteobacteria bacterium]HJM09734.1 dihydroorotase [Gammaproteobacteria bacterium]HJN00561.1 dihydroorotase [Gammaproteobacteria bacterium]|tara:strand:+ start:1542 stop:2897 length:1356 start_codon:yes stop_codon:yes gene_type:complete
MHNDNFMTKQAILIMNAAIVNEGNILEENLLIKNGRIEKVGKEISAPDGAEVIDASGKWLLPGLIDDQVHFREPGLTHKGGIRSESMAAIAGGVTSFMDMPNVNPPTLNRELLSQKYEIAKNKAYANYAFYMGASNHNIDEIKSLKTGEACGLKVFMGASTGNLLVDDDNALEQIFAESPLLIVTHCEDTPTIEENLEAASLKHNGSIPVNEHPNIRSVEACYKSSSKAVSLAKKHGSKLHVLHLTTAKEMELFEAGDHDKRITAEVCVHHLYFNDSAYDQLGSMVVCNPAIKTKADQQALINALNEDRIDIIATDHAPHTFDEKQKPYPSCPSGLPLVQHSLLALLELGRKKDISIETIVKKTSHAVADRYGIKDRGYIREGYWADLVLVDPDGRHEVTPESIMYECGWSPFQSHCFDSSIEMTFINGVKAYENGNILTEPMGMKIEFQS